MLRYWFTFAERVTPRQYLTHGAALMLTKYLSDVALVRIGADQWWSPIDYMRSVSTLQASTLSGAASWLMPALAVWTLPFLWAGITLTLLGALLILFGQEGAICIAMAIPLAFVVALMGGEFGRQIAAETGGDLRPAALGMLTGGVLADVWRLSDPPDPRAGAGAYQDGVGARATTRIGTCHHRTMSVSAVGSDFLRTLSAACTVTVVNALSGSVA